MVKRCTKSTHTHNPLDSNYSNAVEGVNAVLAEVQKQVFRLLGISDEQARARFGFFLDALEYGTPPHGGIAFGLDRIVAIKTSQAKFSERFEREARAR